MIEFGFETHLLLSEDGYVMIVNEDIQQKENSDDEDDGYVESSDDSDERPLFVDPSNNLGSLYTPFEFGHKM